jgi:flagellar hook-associated protein 2
MATTSAVSGSGIDVDAIVSGLMTIERQPLTTLKKKEESYQAKITALGTLKSKVDALQTAARNLGSSSSSTLQGFKSTTSDSSILSATAGSTAVAGTYSLTVTSLAQSQKLVAAGQTSSTAAIGDGTSTVVTFDFGTISGGTLTNGIYSGASFTSNGTTATITIDSSNNTLQGIRDAINAADIGVTASIVNDGSGTPYRLALSSDSTGVSNSIKISTDGANASITSLLAHDPAGTQNLSQTVTASNAQFSVNGIAISKASNTVTDAIEGVTLNLSKAGTTSLTVERDTAAVNTAASALVTAYNDLYSAMKNTTAYKSGSALAGDRTLQSLQVQMREIAATAVSSGTLTNLFEVGISFKSDGTMQLDSSKLNSAMDSKFNDVAALFSGTTGFATRFEAWSKNVNGGGGTFESQTNSWNRSIKQLNVQIDAMEVRMTSLESMYRQQYSSLNSLLANMQSTSAYLSQQLSK